MKLVKVTKINQVTEENTSSFSGSYNDLTDKPTIPTALSALTEDTTHRVVTDTEKTTWNGKSNLALGETSTTAYRGDRGKTAYDHSQAAHAPSAADNTIAVLTALGDGDITLEGTYFIMYDENDGLPKRFTLATLKAYLDTIYVAI